MPRFAVAVLVLLTLLSGAAHASFTDYVIYLKATDENGNCSANGKVMFGTRTGASSWIDSYDAQASTGAGTGICMGFFNMGAGMNGFGWSRDFTAPPCRDGHWLLKLWLEPNCAAQQIKLSGWNPSGTYAFVWSEVHLGGHYDPTGTFTSYEPVYTWNNTSFGTENEPQFTVTINNAQRAKGLDNAITFIMLPEPSGIAGLLLGMAGFAGFALRRRR